VCNAVFENRWDVIMDKEMSWAAASTLFFVHHFQIKDGYPDFTTTTLLKGMGF
jgi:hypothetical protein